MKINIIRITVTVLLIALSIPANAFDFGSVSNIMNSIAKQAIQNPQATKATYNPTSKEKAKLKKKISKNKGSFQKQYMNLANKLSKCKPNNHKCISNYTKQITALQASKKPRKTASKKIGSSKRAGFKNEYHVIANKLANCPPRNNACLTKYSKQLNALQGRANGYANKTKDRNFDGKIDAIDRRLELDQPLMNQINKRKADQYNKVLKEYQNSRRKR